jgi:hypothetical protein
VVSHILPFGALNIGGKMNVPMNDNKLSITIEKVTDGQWIAEYHCTYPFYLNGLVAYGENEIAAFIKLQNYISLIKKKMTKTAIDLRLLGVTT